MAPPTKKANTRKKPPPTPFEQLCSFGITKKSQIPFIVPKGYHAVGEPDFVFTSVPGYREVMQGKQLHARVLIGGVVSSVTPHRDEEHSFFYFQFIGLGNSPPLTVKAPKSDSELVRRAKDGTSLFLSGNLTRRLKGDVATPLLEDPEIVSPLWFNRVEAIYKSRGTLSSSKVRDLMESEVSGSIRFAARFLRDRLHVPDLHAEWALLRAIHDTTTICRPFKAFEPLLWAVHAPDSPEHGEFCIQLLRRLMALEMLQDIRRSRHRPAVPESQLSIPTESVAHAIGEMRANPGKPISLTEEQETAITEIVEDLRSPVPMMRMVSGDTGSGKTFCFLVPAVAAARHGYKVVIQVPNTILANQHFDEVMRFWPDVRPQLFIGSTLDEVPGSNFLIGTTALHFRLPEEWVPDLVVVDEQHKHGTDQRSFLLGKHSNVLEVTATCIPRSQALVKYDGLDVSILRECHVKKEIVTKVVPPLDPDSEMDRLVKMVSLARDRGRKMLVIYPWVDPSSSLPEEKQRRSLVSEFPMWQELLGDRVRMVYGSMPAEEKIAAVDAIRNGEADVLVGTKVIEFGLDLPDLRQAVIFDPDLYGLAALHQMRGRLARSGGKAACYLHLSRTHATSESVMETLEGFCGVTNGFDIADIDLSARMMGDVKENGTQQSGRYSGFLVGHTVEDEDVRFIERRCWKFVKWADAGIPEEAESDE